MKRLTLALLAITLVGIATAQENNSWKRKVSPTLFTRAADGQSTPILILLSDKADISGAHQLRTKEEKAYYVFNKLKANATSSQQRLIALLNELSIRHEDLFIVNGIRAKANLEQIKLFAQRTDVRKIIDDATAQISIPTPETSDAGGSRTIEWGIDMINADEVWNMGFRGAGVVVGGEDTGYQWNHEAIKNQYRGYDADRDTVDHNYNWHDAIHEISPLSNDSINPCGLDSKEPCDDFGHGSHTMGTMVGLEGDNEIGVSPESKWCGCRNMESGNGSPFTYLECFQWFLAPTDLNNQNPDPSKSPHVINNSWGCPAVEGCDSTNWNILDEAVINLKAAGVVVVLSAGNSGSGCSSVEDPAAIFEASFTVGATAENDTIAGFSSRGPVIIDGSNRTKPNVSAPGVRVRSVKLGGGYTKSSGTSMAGPHVAGLVALVICANPDLAGQVEVIENIIESTCVPKTTDQNCGDIPGSQVPNNTYGFGRVDALAAVQAALAIPTATHDETASSQINVYPNPVSDEFIVATNQLSGKMQLFLFDAQGRLALQHQWITNGMQSEKIHLQDNVPGVYVYRVINDNAVKQGVVVKQ